MDNEYYKAILDGKWPDGWKILEESIKKYNLQGD
jgi:hypothetical protein